MGIKSPPPHKCSYENFKLHTASSLDTATSFPTYTHEHLWPVGTYENLVFCNEK